MTEATIVATLSTALVGGAGIALYLVGRASWRWKELDAAGRARITRQVFLTSLLFAFVVGVPASIAALVIDHVASPIVVGIPVAVAVAIWLDRSTRLIDEVVRLGRQLEDPHHAPRARDRLLSIAGSASPDDPMGVSVIISAATVLSNEGFDREALPLFESVNPDKLSDHQRELRSLGLVDALLTVGDIERARTLLAELPPTAGGFHAYARQGFEAKLLLADGKPDEALELLSEPVTEPEIEREVERGRQVIRAHCHAALGRLGRCHEALEWLHTNFGEAGIRRVTQMDGPAAPHARAWLERRAAPYRG